VHEEVNVMASDAALRPPAIEVFDDQSLERKQLAQCYRAFGRLDCCSVQFGYEISELGAKKYLLLP
jgi:hypothetical protein